MGAANRNSKTPWRQTALRSLRRLRETQSKERGQRFALVEQVVRTTQFVVGGEVINPHGVVDGFGDVRRRQRLVGWIFSQSIARSIGLAASDAAAGQYIGEAVRPVIATGARLARRNVDHRSSVCGPSR